MTTDRLKELIADPDTTKIIDAVKTFRKSYGKDALGVDVTVEDILKEYDPLQHDIHNKTKRPDRQVKDAEGKVQRIEDVARLSIPYEKMIVNRRASFLCGNPIELDCAPKDATEENQLAIVKKIWDDNKLDYKSKKIAKIMFSETECAELWFSEKVDPLYWDGYEIKSDIKPRILILANSLGDTLYPVYDLTGNMIAFGRGFTIKVDGKPEAHMDLYTEEIRYKYTEQNGTWSVETEPNPFKKIPVIYYSQPSPEWRDVAPLINRREAVTSKRSDTNDYFGSPKLITDGAIIGMAAKGTAGEIYEVDKGVKMEYLTWTQSPESVNDEVQDLDEQIHVHTGMPKLTEEEVKGLGNYSGVALKMLFLPAHMEAANKEEIFGESIQRRINFLKNTVGILDTRYSKSTLSIKPKFEYYLPKDDVEKINNLVTAVTGGIMSKETAVKQNPLVEDGDTEFDLVKAEGEAQQKADGLDSLMNVA